MDKAPIYYSIIGSVTRVSADGWRSTTYTPTFFLRDDMQGITGAGHAEGIALHMIKGLVGDDKTVVSIHVGAVVVE